MAENDFDLDGLAMYLHFTPQQVERLANRGKVPGRKVGGQWRFSKAEIHHWMEQRMGLLEESELAHVENVLTTHAGATAPISIAQSMPLEAIALPLAARTRNAVIEAMVDLAARTGLLWDAPRMAEAVRAREDMQSTAMDTGVALLHPRRPLASALAEPLVALGITQQGIPFGGSRNLTDVFFLVCSVDDRGHLRSLARLSRLLGTEGFLAAIRAADNAKRVQAVIAEFERDLT